MSHTVRTTLVLLYLVASSQFALAQEMGRIAGRVVSSEGAALLGATVIVEDTGLSATSDIEGRYLIKEIPVGQYDITFTKDGFQKATAQGLTILKNETAKLDFVLPSNSAEVAGELIELDAFVVSASYVQNSDAGLLASRSNASAIEDAMGTDMMSRLSVSDAADAIRRLPGISVTDGKYAVVRGLDDRYGNTTLNGLTLPSPDPDRQAVQLDIFPSELLDAVTASKSFTPDMPSNSSGGSIAIKTKSFPEQFTLSVSGSIGYDSIATGNDRFLQAPRSSSDWYGLGADSRKMPENATINYPRLSKEEFSRSNDYARQMSATRNAPGPNYGYGAAFGNSWNVFQTGRLGAVFGFSYDRSFKFEEGSQSNEWVNNGNNLETGLLFPRNYGTYDRGSEEVLWGALAGLAYQFNGEHEINVNVFNVVSGINEATEWRGYNDTSSEIDDLPLTSTFDPTRINYQRVFKSLLYYTERRLTSLQINGKHAFPGFMDSTLDWTTGTTRTTQTEPDVRSFATLEAPNRDPVIYAAGTSGGTYPQRFFRDLVEDRDNLNLNYKIKYSLADGMDGSFKLGGAWEKSDRTYAEYSTDYRKGRAGSAGSADYNSINDFDSYYDGTLAPYFIPSSARYTSEANTTREITGLYVMFDQDFFRDLKLITGVRFDQTETAVAGRGVYSGAGGAYPRVNDPILDPDGNGLAESASTVDSWLPAATVVYKLTPSMNIRLSYSQTLALPSMRELSPYYSQFLPGDPVQLGNQNLVISKVSNYDLRWEWFTGGDGVVAITLFTKEIQNPIERIVLLDSTAGGGAFVTSWDNNDNKADLRGVEFEARRNLSFIHDSLEPISIGMNFTYIDAKVDLDPVERAKKTIGYGGNPDAVPTSRRLEGQPEWIYNLDLSYDLHQTGTNFSLAFYWISDRLEKVAGSSNYDTYTQSYETLDLIISQKLGDHWKLKLAAKNLTASKRDIVYDTQASAATYVEKSVSTPRTYSLSASYEF